MTGRFGSAWKGLCGLIPAWGHLLPTGLVAPVLLFAERFSWPVVAAAGLGLIGWLVVEGVWSGRTIVPIGLLLLPLAIQAGVSYWASADLGLTRPRLALLLLGVAVLWQLARPARTVVRDLALWSRLFLGGLVLLGVAGPLVTEFRWSNKFFDLTGFQLRVFETGEVLDINILGCLMAVGVPLAMALAVAPDAGRGRRWAWGAVLAILGGVLVLTQARAAYLGAAAGISVVAALRWPRGRWVVAAGAAGAVGVVWWLGWGEIRNLLAEAGSVGSLESRLELWNRSIYAMQDFPFTGIGAGMFTRVIPLLYPLFLVAPDATPPHAHNFVLQVVLDLGIPGLVAFSALVGLAVLKGWGKLAAPGRAWTIGWFGALAAILVNGVFDSPLWLNKPHPVIFFLLALLMMEERGGRGQASRWRRLLRGLMVFGLWILVSLAAISLVGDYPYGALALAILGGLYLGWEAKLAGGR